MSIHSQTPLLTVLDSRANAVRKVAFCRTPGNDDVRVDVTGMAYDHAGRIDHLWDPRLWASALIDLETKPNRTHLYSLSGIPLLSDSVDASWDLTLLRESGVVDQSWDAKHASWRSEYDALLRPVAQHEIAANGSSRMMARYVYAESTEASAASNQCGQMVEHYDDAGVIKSSAFNLLGQCVSESRLFLHETALPDWSGSPLLDEAKTTLALFTALGEPATQTDASGHRQRFSQNIAGITTQAYLTLNGEAETVLLASAKYNAAGQVESETAGNDVVVTSTYDPISERLVSARTLRAGSLLQHLEYRYDSVGNVTEVTDTAQTARFFRNQQVAPTNTYQYDSLYQLVEASGRESVDSSDSHRPPENPAPNPGDTSQLLNYRETYRYDQGGNMLELRHIRDGNTYTREFVVSETSNRSLLKIEGQTMPGFDSAFDAAGNLLVLQPGQLLQWDLRNQLRNLSTVSRADGEDDQEVYVYDSDDQRVRKVRTSRTQNTLRNDTALYLPGLEIRTSGTDAITDEHLEVITVQTGRFNVRCLHWVAGKPDDIAQNQIRYGLSDHLGSCAWELDQNAELISHEGYFPFGGTAWWVARSVIEGTYKTIRYSGKELDVSGLYYYGYRYYACWLQRWINPDPWGEVDGLNVYQLVGNNPSSYIDTNGATKDRRVLQPSESVMHELRRQSEDVVDVRTRSPEGTRASYLTKNIRSHGDFHDFVYLRIKTMKMIRRRLKAVNSQLDSIIHPFKRMERIPSALIGHLTRSSVGTLTGWLGAPLAALATTLGGPPLSAAVGVAAGSLGEQAADTALQRFGHFHRLHLVTSRMNPDDIHHQVIVNANVKSRAIGVMRTAFPTEDRKAMVETSTSTGLGTISAIGNFVPGAMAIIKFSADLYSSLRGKSMEKN